MIPIQSNNVKTEYKTWFPKVVAVLNYEEAVLILKTSSTIDFVYCLNEKNNSFLKSSQIEEIENFYKQ